MTITSVLAHSGEWLIPSSSMPVASSLVAIMIDGFG
jgi:hypothetical protein